jgi:hypothetical protein
LHSSVASMHCTISVYWRWSIADSTTLSALFLEASCSTCYTMDMYSAWPCSLFWFHRISCNYLFLCEQKWLIVVLNFGWYSFLYTCNRFYSLHFVNCSCCTFRRCCLYLLLLLAFTTKFNLNIVYENSCTLASYHLGSL